MLKFEYYVELKEGYKPVMQTEEETDVKFVIEAKNRATADRMVKALNWMKNLVLAKMLN